MKKPKLTPPLVRLIRIDPTVSLMMLSTPPGNPGSAPGFGPPAWGQKQLPWAEDVGGGGEEDFKRG